MIGLCILNESNDVIDELKMKKIDLLLSQYSFS